MSERSWELDSSAALDGELDPVETLELLDAMATESECREHWLRLRAFDRQLDPVIRPADRDLPARRRTRIARAWWLAPMAAAALFVFAVLQPELTELRSLPDPEGQPLTVRLQANEGEMTEARFVELVLEVLQADQRYQDKMLEVLEEVRPDASLAEAGSSEDDDGRTERLALAETEDEGPATPMDELPWEALAGIH
jgi:hypothetical protein